MMAASWASLSVLRSSVLVVCLALLDPSAAELAFRHDGLNRRSCSSALSHGLHTRSLSLSEQAFCADIHHLILFLDVSALQLGDTFFNVLFCMQ